MKLGKNILWQLTRKFTIHPDFINLTGIFQLINYQIDKYLNFQVVKYSNKGLSRSLIFDFAKFEFESKIETTTN